MNSTTTELKMNSTELPKTDCLKSGITQDISKMNSIPFSDIQDKQRSITYTMKEGATWEEANKWLEDTWSEEKNARWKRFGNQIYFWIQPSPEDDEEEEDEEEGEIVPVPLSLQLMNCRKRKGGWIRFRVNGYDERTYETIGKEAIGKKFDVEKWKLSHFKTTFTGLDKSVRVEMFVEAKTEDENAYDEALKYFIIQI